MRRRALRRPSGRRPAVHEPGAARCPSTAPRALLQYRGYDTSEELPNHPAQTRAKRRAFDGYLALGVVATACDLELDDAGDPARAAIEPQRWTWLPPG